MGKHDELAMLLGATPKGATFRRFLMASYAESTKEAYRGNVKHFKAWGGKIPSTEIQVARYLAAFAGRLAYASLEQRLSALHREHLTRGYKSPVRTELVRATLRGIARVYGRKQRQAQPLLKEHLVKIMRHLRGTIGVRDKALLLVGFVGGFRCSELVGLDVEDIEREADGLVLQLRRSKTDQEGEGRGVPIPRLRGKLCPVRALQTWVRKAGISQGPIFRGVNRHGAVQVSRMRRESVCRIVKSYAEKIGLDPKLYSAHSLRAGLVTAAARAGAAAWQIKKQTGHKSDEVLAGYIRDGGQFTNNVARMIFRN